MEDGNLSRGSRSRAQMEDRREKLNATGADAVLKYYVLKNLPDGKGLPELAQSFVAGRVKITPPLQDVPFEVEQQSTDEQQITKITLFDSQHRPSIQISITWTQDQGLLDTIKSFNDDDQTSFTFLTHLIQSLEISAPANVIKELQAHSLSQEQLELNTINANQVAQRVLNKN